jgi:hypothetical protein
MYGERCCRVKMEGMNGVGLEKAGCDIPRWSENENLRSCFYIHKISFFPPSET